MPYEKKESFTTGTTSDLLWPLTLCDTLLVPNLSAQPTS